MANLTSSLTIKLIDDVSKPARSVSQALKDAERKAREIAKAMAETSASDRLRRSLAGLKLSAKDIETVAAAWKDYARSSGLAAKSSDWTRTQLAGVRAWETQTIGALRAVKREQQQFYRAQERAMRRARAPLAARDGIVGYAAQGLAGAVAARSIFAGARDALGAGADIQSQRVKMRAAGIGATEIGAADLQASRLAAQFTNLKREAILEVYKEIRSVLLRPEEAEHLLPTVAAAKSAMDALDRTGGLSGGLQFAVKGAEVLCRTQDPKRFQDYYLNAFVRAQQVMGKTITPENIFELAKYTKASGAGLSDRFLTTTGLSLAQEMGGMTAGAGVDQFVKQIVGGFQGQNHAAAKEFVRLGLAQKDDFQTTKTGEIKGMKSGRKVDAAALAQSDPDIWTYRYLLPALKKAGIVDQQDQIAEIRRLFPAVRAADFVTKLVTQRPSFENHARLYAGAQGIDERGAPNRADPYVALDSLSKSLTNFAGAVTSPAMANVGETLSKIADGIGGLQQRVAEWARANPDLAPWVAGGAMAAGVGGAGLLSAKIISGLTSGFGLSASAAELSAAATALDAAAVKLGGGSVAADIVKKGAPAALALSGGALATLAAAAAGIAAVAAVGARAGDMKGAVFPLHDMMNERGAFKPWGPPPGKFEHGGPRLDLPFPSDQNLAAKEKAEEAKSVFDSLNTTVSPVVSTTSADAAIAKWKELLSLIKAADGAATSAASSIGKAASVNIPPLGRTQRGNFSFGGVQGE